MTTKDPRRIVPSRGGGFFSELSLRVKLILRLVNDPRVSPLLKALPIGTLVYLLFPDILIGPFDDAAVIWLGTTLFVELCPPNVVQEHMDALRKVIPAEWDRPEDVVDGEYKDMS